jgi:outer membrane protein OmpA-like peptidoglycan-associated protein
MTRSTPDLHLDANSRVLKGRERRKLALQRADAVRRALLELSFPAECLYAVGVGSRPAQCATDHDACQRQNRRVYFRAAQTATRTGGDAR